jgi:hypothetical protein
MTTSVSFIGTQISIPAICAKGHLTKNALVISPGGNIKAMFSNCSTSCTFPGCGLLAAIPDGLYEVAGSRVRVPEGALRNVLALLERARFDTSSKARAAIVATIRKQLPTVATVLEPALERSPEYWIGLITILISLLGISLQHQDAGDQAAATREQTDVFREQLALQREQLAQDRAREAGSAVTERGREQQIRSGEGRSPAVQKVKPKQKTTESHKRRRRRAKAARRQK